MFRYYKIVARNFIMATKRQTTVSSFFQSSEPAKKAKKTEKPVVDDENESNTPVSILFYSY